jgi:hypothetical protein
MGDVRLGMTRQEVRAMFGDLVGSFRKSMGDPGESDVIGTGLFIYYDEYDRAEAIELFSPEEPVLEGQRLLGRPFSEVRHWLESQDPDLEVDGAGATSRRVGISIYAPAALKAPTEPVESVMVFRRGYHH